MSRLIDADKLKAAITVDGYEHFSGCLSSSEVSLLEMVMDDIDEAPTIDAVPVVRCRECEYRKKLQYDGQYHCCNEDAGMATGVVLNDNDFCSYGKQKEGNKND